MKPTVKSEEVKIRVTKQEKEQLKKLSASSESMSAYILKKSLSTDTDHQNTIVETVEMSNLLNMVLLEIDRSIDELLRRRTRLIMERGRKNEQ